MATAIAFRSVTKRFPDGTLGLADATWHVAEGVHACLLGGSASGKTTAVRMLQAALRPTGGSVLLLGVPVDGPGYREVRGRLGIVPQGPGMYPDLTAGEYMALASRLYGARPERAVDALDLGEYLSTRMTYLSPNFQRRLALAAALVAGTAVLCTHKEQEARALCQEVAILRAGRVVAQGTWDDLARRTRPRLRVAARQGVDRVLAELAELGMHGDADGDAVLVATADPQQEGASLLRRLLEAGLDVYQFAPVEPEVKDIILEAFQ